MLEQQVHSLTMKHLISGITRLGHKHQEIEGATGLFHPLAQGCTGLLFHDAQHVRLHQAGEKAPRRYSLGVWFISIRKCRLKLDKLL
ncbi:hypothetical protein D3C84_1109580 [compost metagenome]